MEIWSTPPESIDPSLLRAQMSESARGEGVTRLRPLQPPAWAVSGQVDVPGNPPGAKTRTLGVHLSTVFMSKQLLFLMGSSLEETFVLSSGYQNIVPVRSSGGQLTLLHPSAPFLFRGTKTYYGCERCSEAAVREPVCAGEGKILDEKIIAEALGVLELQDVSDSLHVFLWRNAEEFFGVSAEDAAANQEAQDIISQSMDSLPSRGQHRRASVDGSLSDKVPKCGGRRSEPICYQISHSTFTRPPAPPSANPA
ncbi:hypothetical protein KUCAC02_031512 [Chaenocephalus aceratus]|nr:hypothetical protein KUCAC02_031512 [Chaenocephalus aceratus]